MEKSCEPRATSLEMLLALRTEALRVVGILAESAGPLCDLWFFVLFVKWIASVALPFLPTSFPQARAIRCKSAAAQGHPRFGLSATIANALLTREFNYAPSGLEIMMIKDPRAAPWAIDFSPSG